MNENQQQQSDFWERSRTPPYNFVVRRIKFYLWLLRAGLMYAFVCVYMCCVLYVCILLVYNYTESIL